MGDFEHRSDMALLPGEKDHAGPWLPVERQAVRRIRQTQGDLVKSNNLRVTRAPTRLLIVVMKETAECLIQSMGFPKGSGVGIRERARDGSNLLRGGKLAKGWQDGGWKKSRGQSEICSI